MSNIKETPKRRGGPGVDCALDVEAQGMGPTSDDTAALEYDSSDETETDAIGRAAGIRAPRNKPLGGGGEVAGRDAHRWELDPKSADDAGSRR